MHEIEMRSVTTHSLNSHKFSSSSASKAINVIHHKSMFIILPPRVSSSHYHPHRRHCRVKHRGGSGGRCNRSHPLFRPNVLVKLNDIDYPHSEWMPRRHCAAMEFIDTDETMEEEPSKAPSRPIESPESVKTTATTTLPTCSPQNAQDSSVATKTTSSTDGTTVSSRHETCEEKNTILERTPVHRQETEESATVSMDVSGFALDQLQVRLEEEEKGTKFGFGRPRLTVHGERTNLLGDKFKIHRRFQLDRDNLAHGNLQDLAISANLSKEGILTIRIPKKKKGAEKEVEKVSRTIPVQQQKQDTDSEEQSNETTIHDESNDKTKTSA
jgi:HSP20 family molecular chaperone IbpA